MSLPTGVEHSSALGGEAQRSIYCYSGIDIFVLLRTDSTESTQIDDLSSWASSDAPKPIQVLPRASVPPLLDVVGNSSFSSVIVDNLDREHHESSLEGTQRGSRSDEEPSCAKVAPGDLDKDVMLPREVLRPESEHVPHDETSKEQIRSDVKQSRQVEEHLSVPDVGVTGFVARPIYELHRVQVWNDHPDELSGEDDHVNPCDQEGLCRQFKYGFPAGENVVRGCHYSASRENSDELKCGSHEDFDEDQYKSRSRTDENPYFCNENRRWSPQVQDYHWVQKDLSRDPHNQVTGCNTGRTDLEEELGQTRANLPRSSFPFEEATVRRMHLEHDAISSLESMLRRKFPEKESSDVAEMSAACELVHMKNYKYREEFREQGLSALCGVYNLGFRGVSNKRMLSNIAEKTYAASLDLDIPCTRNALQQGGNKMELSLWSDPDDRYIPRLARRAKARLRGSKFSTRVEFRSSEIDEESDCEALRRHPRKRQYKPLQELLRA